MPQSGAARPWMTSAFVGVALAMLILVQLGVLFETLASNGHLADAASYKAAVERWLAGDSPYSASQLAGPHTIGSAVGGNGFVYPPTALLILAPLALGVHATVVWVLLTHLAFLAAVFVIARRSAPEPAPVFALAAVALALALPGMAEIRFGNASAFVAALIGFAWLSPRSMGLLGLVGAAVKVFPLALTIWSLRVRSGRRATVAVALALGAGSFVVGPGLWGAWITAMTNAVPSCPEWAVPSVACVVGHTAPGYLLAAVLFAGAMTAPTPATGFFLLSVAMVVPAPDLYQHYLLVPFVGLLPLAGQLLRDVLPMVSVARPLFMTRVARSRTSP